MIRVLLAVALTLSAAPLAAQTRSLTLDDLFDPRNQIDFSGDAPSGLRWISDSHYAWPRPNEREQVEWVRVDAATGAIEPLFDAQKLRAAFDALPGLRSEDVAALPATRRLEMNPTGTAILVSIADDLYYYPLGADRAFRLTFDPAREEEFSFSPDGRQAAFVRNNNLFVVNVEQQRQERQLTTSGTSQILNGKLDWVYQEEIYGRGNFKAYWWSPDSSHLAFLQVDDRPVPEFTVVDHIPARLNVEEWEYPKAGDPNPVVKLGVIPVVGGHVQWVDLGKYSASEFLIVNVGWTPDSARVVYQVQNREQSWLDLNIVPPSGQKPTTLFRETTKAWVDVNGPPLWQKDGSFLWLSDRSGFKHLYRYKADGTLLGPVTRGVWDIRRVHGLHDASGLVYFSAAERSHIEVDVYCAKVDGSGMTRLSERRGTHRATFSPGFVLFLDSWSDLHTPPQVRVHKADGTEVRLIHDGKIPQLAQFRLSKPELLQVPTRDGFVMEAMLIKPLDFDPSRRYPVMQFTYGGPGAASVRNAWGGQDFMYHQLLAQHGVAVWVCDNRLASGKGAQSQWPSYKNLGELELRDVEDGLAYLRKQSWVDPTRIGIDGWSFGGYMVTYALTHSTSFAMGIGGGNVTDWRLYDSIYTERFMLMPQNNPDGYDKSSPLLAAKNLHGQILLIHGAIDENVHAQNTLKFGYELQKAGKPFRLMLYEKSRHGVTEPDLVEHMQRMKFDFTLETLRPSDSRTSAKSPTAPPAK
jgi:dipeptidyl-peptidase-4